MTGTMFLRTHRVPDGTEVVAVCDRTLINTTQSFGDISVEVTESFYGSTPADDADVREAMKTAGNANLIGEQAVSIAVEMGLVDRSACIMIGDVPHAQIYRI